MRWTMLPQAGGGNVAIKGNAFLTDRHSLHCRACAISRLQRMSFLNAQIGLLDFGIIQKVVAGIGYDDASRFEHVDSL